MKFFKFVLLTFIALPAILWAEGGSVYSRLGIGDLTYSYSARRIGMGELGVAVSDREFIGSINPASWTRLNMTRFETALNFQNFKTQSSDISSYHSYTNFSGAVIGVPLERDLGLSLVGGMIPYSTVNYKVVEKHPGSDYPNNVTYDGSGNVSKAFIGGSYKTPWDISIGASFDYYIGKVDYHSTIDFTSNSSYYSAEYQKTYKTAGIGGSFGIISNDLSKMLGLSKISEMRVGLALNVASSFNSDSSYIVYNTNGTDTLATGKTNADLPLRFAAGLSFVYNKAYNITLDYLYQPWNKYKFGNQSALNLRSLQKVSAGIEYKNPDMRETGFFERTMVRGGVSYEQTQYQLYGQGINEYSVYAGFSFPLAYENSIDLAFQYGVRGTTDMSLVKEKIFRTNVTISLGELWFFRPER